MRGVSRKRSSLVSIELDYSSSIFNFGLIKPLLKERMSEILIFFTIVLSRAALEP
ncbi:hypothetical protein IKE71_00535 [Candidatus Saccharibacteria bacterium]|nr:hypothetical protein [Candidatus Saccharibacteria bacterium]